MKKLLLFATLCLLASTAIQAAPPTPGNSAAHFPVAIGTDKGLAGFTFDADNMAWLQTWIGRPDGTGYDRLYDNTDADWSGSEGNPPGSILQTVDSGLEKRAYWQGYFGSTGFLGELTGAFLSCDVYSTGNWQTIANGASGDDGHVYARWVVSSTCASDPGKFDMFISIRAASIDLNSFTGWHNFTVGLDPGNFMRWPNSPCGAYDFAQVLLNYDQVGLYVFSGSDDLSDYDGSGATWITLDGVSRLQHYGAYATSGTATWGIDNFFATGPVPSEAASFGEVKALFR